MGVTLTCIDTPSGPKERGDKPAPSRCDLCSAKLKSYFVNGMTRHGLAKTMCVTCHDVHGIGLGVGHGVLNEITTTGTAVVWGA